MNLHEYQAKQLFARYGLPVPAGYACKNAQEALEAADKLGEAPWVLKCQVHAGGRGKSGGVMLAKNQEDILSFTQRWFGQRLATYQTVPEGLPVGQILLKPQLTLVRSFI